MRTRAAAPLALLLLTGCGSPYRAEDLASEVGTAFGNLYQRAQGLAGRPAVAPGSLGIRTTCERGGIETADEGPGDDWRCTVVFTDPTSGPQQVLYEVVLKPEGCFTADGPPGVVGDARVVAVDGTRHVNPLYAFDGCL